MNAAKKLPRSQAEQALELAIKEGRVKLQTLSIKAIKADPRFQSRVATDPAHIKHLADLMAAGIELRRVVVFRDPETSAYRLADGFHRLGAHKAHKLDSIKAYVLEGIEKDVAAYSASANLENSLPTTRQDRKKATWMIMSMQEFSGISSGELSRMCGISVPTASRYREEFYREMGLNSDNVRVVYSRSRKPYKIDLTNIYNSNNKRTARGMLCPRGNPCHSSEAKIRRLADRIRAELTSGEIAELVRLLTDESTGG